MSDEFTTLIIKIIFAILSTAVTMYLIPYLKTLSERNMDKKLREFIKEAVYAAEQVLHEPGSGVKKKNVVVNETQLWLKNHNINLTDAELDNMIEAMVYAMNNAKEVLLND